MLFVFYEGINSDLLLKYSSSIIVRGSYKVNFHNIL